jgi:hypothetical protein
MQVQHVDWEKEGGLKISKVHLKDIRSAEKNFSFFLKILFEKLLK